ncbi:MAG: FAD-dependent oxidoreductase, partial [Armatimonadota bacterium]
MKTISRAAAEIPVMLETEVLVYGGGPAGVAAALAAARRGAKVTLLERYNHLGGLATGGLVVVLPHFIDNGRQTIGGIGLETRDAMLATGEAWSHSPHNDSCYFDPEALKWLHVKQCVDAGVEVLHHCWLSGAVVDGVALTAGPGTSGSLPPRPSLRETVDGLGGEGENGHGGSRQDVGAPRDGGRRVTGVVFESKLGTQVALAELVIDATGDGDVFAWAGAAYEKSDQAIGIPFRVGGLDIEAWMKWVGEHPDESRLFWEKVKTSVEWPSDMFYIAAMNREQGTAWGNNFYRE